MHQTSLSDSPAAGGQPSEMQNRIRDLALPDSAPQDQPLFVSHGIGIWRSVLSAEECDALVSPLDFSAADYQRVMAHPADRTGRIDRDNRETKSVTLDPIRLSVELLFNRLVTELVEPAFAATSRGRERVQLLAYEAGGYYRPHWDGVEKMPDGRFVRVLDRDISMILYLSDGFTGGHLRFPDRDITIRPERGMFLAFPSGPDHRHAAMPVFTGLRLALVTWMPANLPADPRWPAVAPLASQTQARMQPVPGRDSK